ncbi:hypothetical protein Tco_0921875, partial [Tanacetum coccineum]
FQVTLKTSHILVVKRIFKNLKGKPTLGLWHSRDSPFELVAYTDSDYAGATQDRKSKTGGCQFLRNRLISWQCKKQNVVATSITKAEYVVAASCCGQVLWIQNQLLDYGYNFMNTVLNIDNNSTICIIENPVQHSKTKHIEIRHHLIRDCNAKKLIQMVKIHTDHNVADLLTKGFDAGRVNTVKISLTTTRQKISTARKKLVLLSQSMSKEVGTPRYLSLVVPLKKVGDEAIYKVLGDRMERVVTTASSLEPEQESDVSYVRNKSRVQRIDEERVSTGRLKIGCLTIPFTTAGAPPSITTLTPPPRSYCIPRFMKLLLPVLQQQAIDEINFWDSKTLIEIHKTAKPKGLLLLLQQQTKTI